MFPKKKVNDNATSWTDKAAGKIAGVGLRVQAKFSSVMNGFFFEMPVKKLKLFLILFCLAAGGYSIYLASQAVFGATRIEGVIKVDGVNIPGHFDQAEGEVVPPTQIVTHEMYEEIQAYKRHMDSMRRPIRQSLLDSITILEEFYQSQTKK